MRLSCFPVNIDLLLEENKAQVLILENQIIFSEFLERLNEQFSGRDRDILLSDDEKKLSISKVAEVVYTPILLDLNSKKIQTHLFKEMCEISTEYFSGEKEYINSAIIDILDKITEKMPYPVSFSLDSELTPIFKQYDVHLDFGGVSLIEKLLAYIQLEKQLCDTQLIIFVNLKAYIGKEELGELYKTAFYNKVQIILVESQESYCLHAENYYIIDKNKCVIQHN